MEHGDESGLPPKLMTHRLQMTKKPPAIYLGPATSLSVQGVRPSEGGTAWQAYACSIGATAAGGWTIQRRNILDIAIGPDLARVGWHPRSGGHARVGARVFS